jgi:hypothetical protein
MVFFPFLNILYIKSFYLGQMPGHNTKSIFHVYLKQILSEASIFAPKC